MKLDARVDSWRDPVDYREDLPRKKGRASEPHFMRGSEQCQSGRRVENLAEVVTDRDISVRERDIADHVVSKDLTAGLTIHRAHTFRRVNIARLLFADLVGASRQVGERVVTIRISRDGARHYVSLQVDSGEVDHDCFDTPLVGVVVAHPIAVMIDVDRTGQADAGWRRGLVGGGALR